MEFIHSVLAQNETVTQNTVRSYDLPVNPLSFILLTLKFTQTAIGGLAGDWDKVDAMIAKVEVLYKGSAIYSSNGSDLCALDNMLLGYEPWINNRLGVDEEETFFTFLIPLGRKLYCPRECFPRSVRGELILQITYQAVFQEFDEVRAQIETVELPEASPERFLRVTTLSITPSAIGELDVELPIGNLLAGVLFFGTTKPAGAADTFTLQYSQLLIDNQRRYFSHINAESWRQMAAIRHKPPIAHAYHQHQLVATPPAQFDMTGPVLYRNDWTLQHMWWDFDPLRDGTYLLDTAGASDIVARIYAGAQDALRVLPCELVASGKGY